jgi:hypothetical protein
VDGDYDIDNQDQSLCDAVNRGDDHDRDRISACEAAQQGA